MTQHSLEWMERQLSVEDELSSGEEDDPAGSVSYTHLDVYKRQQVLAQPVRRHSRWHAARPVPRRCLLARWSFVRLSRRPPDVYKRQV